MRKKTFFCNKNIFVIKTSFAIKTFFSTKTSFAIIPFLRQKFFSFLGFLLCKFFWDSCVKKIFVKKYFFGLLVMKMFFFELRLLKKFFDSLLWKTYFFVKKNFLGFLCWKKIFELPVVKNVFVKKYLLVFLWCKVF